MTSNRLWDRAASLPVATTRDRRRPEVAALATDLPSVEELFTFMRDAEHRFDTLRMRIEERSFTAIGEHLTSIDVSIRHPGHARVTTSRAGQGSTVDYEIWVSDGSIIRTFSGLHRLGTQRPIRNRPRGLDRDFPGMARVYDPLTPLPMETLPETFIHPAGYSQNVLATGRCWISGTDVVGGREAIVLECGRPRSVEIVADRPDFHIQVAVDRGDGAILRLVETIADEVTREAETTAYQPNRTIPTATFDFEFPEGATILY